MLDYGECSEAVIFQLKNPLRIIEWQAPALQWHGLELKGHHFTQNSRFTIIVHGQSKGAAIKTGAALRAIRQQLGWSMREVHTATVALAKKHRQPAFVIPPSRLHDIECKK